MRQHQAQPVFCDHSMPDQPAIDSNVTIGSEPPSLCIDGRGFPKQIILYRRKDLSKLAQQALDILSAAPQATNAKYGLLGRRIEQA
jgi:hypothetical protein